MCIQVVVEGRLPLAGKKTAHLQELWQDADALQQTDGECHNVLASEEEKDAIGLQQISIKTQYLTTNCFQESVANRSINGFRFFPNNFAGSRGQKDWTPNFACKVILGGG